MKRSKLDETAPLRPTFERERDLLHAKAMNDLSKTEAQRRRESVSHEAARANRRESFMVKRQQPKPHLRPEQHLSMGADRAAFNAEWRLEQRLAQEDQRRGAAIEQGLEAKAALQEAKASTDQTQQKIQHAQTATQPDAAREALKEAFKAFRKSEAKTNHSLALAGRFLRVAPTR